MSSVLIDPWSNPFWAAQQGGIIPYSDSKPTDLQPPFPVDNILILTDGVCNSGMCDTPLLRSTAITNSQLSMRHAGGASETPGQGKINRIWWTSWTEFYASRRRHEG
jgi:hypothetical protein